MLKKTAFNLLTYLFPIRCSAGFAAGLWYGNGWGVDTQCLPLNPEYSRYNPDSYSFVIYGVELQVR